MKRKRHIACADTTEMELLVTRSDSILGLTCAVKQATGQTQESGETSARFYHIQCIGLLFVFASNHSTAA